MKRLTATILVLAMALMCLCSCTKTEQYKSLTPSEAAAAILEAATFTDDLAETSQEMLDNLFGLKDYVESGCAYLGSGATAEEISVWQVKEGQADKVVELLKERVTGLTSDYASYNPDEVPKLESAVVKAYGNVVVCCVSAEPATSAVDGVFTK